jgi:hypothetical protein
MKISRNDCRYYAGLLVMTGNGYEVRRACALAQIAGRLLG